MNAPDTTETTKAPTLLVVDDDPIILALVDRLATEMGFTVLRERNGTAALAALADMRPDGAMVDVGDRKSTRLNSSH